jgi:hypothetical protein
MNTGAIGRRGGHLAPPLLAICLAALLAPGSAPAAVTLGSPMAAIANSGVPGCGTPPCVHSQSVLPGRTTSSPVNGTIVRWRFDYSAAAGTVRLRVIRPLATGGLFSSGPDASFVGIPADLPSSIPISIGDRIGIEQVSGPGNPVGFTGVPGSKLESWDPPPPDGVATPQTFDSIDFELYLNADVEPANTFAVGKVAKNKKKGTAALTVSLPNPGKLEATAALTQPASTIAGPGEVALTLKPTKKTRKSLRRKGKASGQVLLTYTPDFGTASTQTVKVGLKLKKKPKR